MRHLYKLKRELCCDISDIEREALRLYLKDHGIAYEYDDIIKETKERMAHKME